MPKYICPKCKREHSYCKNDNPPVCKCNDAFFIQKAEIPPADDKPDTIAMVEEFSAEIEHAVPKQGEMKSLTKTKRHFRGGVDVVK